MKKKTSGLSVKMNAKIAHKNDSVVARRFIVIGVMVSVLMVGVSLAATVYFNPERLAKQKFEWLAKDYYENYYYEKLMEGIDPALKEEKLAMYAETGLQPVLLRQLLLYQNGKYSDMKGYFEKEGFVCDKNKTSAQFFPVEPYGRTDYTVKYNYSCTDE